MKRDADDLQDEVEFDGGDVVHKMRKVCQFVHLKGQNSHKT